METGHSATGNCNYIFWLFSYLDTHTIIIICIVNLGGIYLISIKGGVCCQSLHSYLGPISDPKKQYLYPTCISKQTADIKTMYFRPDEIIMQNYKEVKKA